MNVHTPVAIRTVKRRLARTRTLKTLQLALIALTFAAISIPCFAANPDRVTAAHLMGNLSFQLDSRWRGQQNHLCFF